LSVVRLESFGPKGALLSDVHYWDWQAAGDSTGTATAATYPRTIRIDRPHDDYRIDLQIAKLSLNEDLPAERFQLAQPPNSELVRVGEEKDAQPAKGSKP